MTQKNKVKELVGRGLDSYHTKSLQQIDRIEKKNKEQNHKISILSNELDNDYLTKTEEGSVVSLEHSKEGMVYLDELQGNTLVNYCTDGSKEMTLNGDIDVEGTYVTTTEGVDNGKVDVMCEGNTLVNLSNTNRYTISKAISDTNLVITSDTNYLKATTNREIYNNNSWIYANFGKPKLSLLKPNTKYTVIGDVIKGIGTMAICEGSTVNALTPFSPVKNNRVLLTTNNLTSEINGQILYGWIKNNEEDKPIDIEVKNLIILEGDWTNKEIPSEYFEGMKSVGQDNVNGHKIEILSSVGKENLIKDSNIYIEQSSTSKTFDSSYKNILDKVQNKTITISVDIEVEDMIPIANGKNRIGCELSVVYEDNTKGYHGIWYSGENFKGRQARTFSITKRIKTIEYFGIYIQCAGKKHKIGRPKLEIGDTNTSWCPSSTDNLNGLQTFMNKKEILLNEPLVGNDTVKDRVVKIGGKSFIERFWETVTLDGTQEIVKGSWDVSIFSYYVPNTEGEPTNFPNTLMCDRIKPQNFNLNDNTHWALYTGKDSVETKRYIRIQIPTSIVTKDDLEGFKTWLRNNPVTIAYRLNTPIYEPLEIEPTLNTYNDVTHISNNSIIPCNMKIKNSGYNAIIKPSTLYTVALDTNKSGTIGMNLGGVKGTTTNNVLKLTTPATLTDDSLRLYGKGIKGSKVRLLEGDKTNWTPSFFEGMKSSFEDKFDATDNTYKMEILSNNKNLFDNTKIPDYTGGDMKYYSGYGGLFKRIENKEYILGNYGGMAFVLNLPKNKTYKISIKVRNSNGSNTKVQSAIFLNKEVIGHTKSTFTTNVTENVIGFGVVNYNENTDLILYDVILSEVIDEYTERKSNKIQFSSIEPLRGLPSGVKDRFVFKDNKLMIERNTKKIFLNNQTISSMTTYDIAHNGTMLPFSFKLKNSDCKKGAYIEVPCNKFATSSNSYRGFPTTCIQQYIDPSACFVGSIHITNLKSKSGSAILEYFNDNNIEVTYQLAEPTYEEIPFELQKIILEGYENGTLFFDTNIPPTSTVTYAGETPIIKSVKLNKTEVLNNTVDINDNIVPYLMDMDYRVVCLQLQSEGFNGGVSMARLFGGAYEMLQRDIQSKRYSINEYKHRLDAYLDANKITEEEYNKLGDMLNE